MQTANAPAPQAPAKCCFVFRDTRTTQIKTTPTYPHHKTFMNHFMPALGGNKTMKVPLGEPGTVLFFPSTKPPLTRYLEAVEITTTGQGDSDLACAWTELELCALHVLPP